LNLAIALREIGDFSAAEPLFRASLKQLVEQLGSDHSQVAVVHTELGALLLATDRVEAAETEYRRSLEIRRAALPASHPHIAWSLLGLGRAAQAQGRLAEARTMVIEAAEIRQAAYPDNNPLRREAEELLLELSGDD